MEREDVVWREQAEACSLVVTQIEGTLPEGLRGTLTRNGTGRSRIGDTQLSMIDGYSMFGALGLRAGEAHLRVVHPETELRRVERQAGRMVKRRLFTNLPGWWRNIANFDVGNGTNHDTYTWGGAFHVSDTGAHYALSAPNLEDLGLRDWGEAVREGELIAAMPREDVARNTLVAHVLEQKLSGDRLTFVEVDAQFGLVHRSASVTLGGFVHDQAFTDRWYVAVQTTAKPRAFPLLAGTLPIWSTMTIAEEGVVLWLVPRGRAGEPVRIEVPCSVRTVFHLINAHEDGEHVVVDFCGYEGAMSFHGVMAHKRGEAHEETPPSRLIRVRADPASGAVEVRPWDVSGEAPTVAPALNGRPYRTTWFAELPTPGPDRHMVIHANAICALDVETGRTTRWRAGDRQQVSPPAFAADAASEDPEVGWLLVWVLDLDTETTDVVVLDAQELGAGPVARLNLGVYLPPPNHCRFAPGLQVSIR